MGIAGEGEIASPLVGVWTAGVLPTGGAVLLAVSLGRAWGRRSGLKGSFMIALGAAIASGAVFTGWGVVTNGLFLVGGLVLAALGVSSRARGGADTPPELPEEVEELEERDL